MRDIEERVLELEEKGFIVRAYPARFASALVNNDRSSTDLDDWDIEDIDNIILDWGYAIDIVDIDPYFGYYTGDGLFGDMCRYVFEQPKFAV